MGGMQSLSGLANAKDMVLGPTLTVFLLGRGRFRVSDQSVDFGSADLFRD